MAILIAIVLPSEYAIDPTGIGRALGLTEMGEIKTQLAEEAAADAALDAEKVATKGSAGSAMPAQVQRETLIKATLPGFFVREAATPKFASS